MQEDNKWFAKPLPKYIRFIAAFKIAKAKLKITDVQMLYALICEIDMDKPDPASKMFKGSAITRPSVKYVRDYFYSMYKDEDACVSLLNKEVGYKYFVSPNKIKYDSKKVSEVTIVENEVKALMDSFFNYE